MLSGQLGCLEVPPSGGEPAVQHSLELFGNPLRDNGVDRVWIPAVRPSPAGRLGDGDFTIELWIKLEKDGIREQVECLQPWFENTILFDREFFNDPPQNGDIGIGLYRTAGGSGVAFGIEVASGQELNLCGDTPIADGAWHHVAVTRSPEDLVSLWVDGGLDEEGTGPTGDASMAEVLTDVTVADRYLVLGGPKQTGATSLGYAGLIDDLRLSDDNLYRGDFDPPYPPLAIDLADTLALWTFDEGEGTRVLQRAGAGAGRGELRVGGDPKGPIWSDDVPAP